MAEKLWRRGAVGNPGLLDAGGRQRSVATAGVHADPGISRDQQILQALVGLTRLVEGGGLAAVPVPAGLTDATDRPSLSIPASIRYDLAVLADTIRSIRDDVQALRRNSAVVSLPVRGDGGGAMSEAAWPVSAAEAATDTILNAVDRIDSAVSRFVATSDSVAGSDLAASVDAETVRIVEACNAQDVVLRRLHRVVEAVVALEPVIDRLIASADGFERI